MSYMPKTITKTFTIANAASLSDEVDLEDYRLAAIQMSTGWTAANLTFQGATAKAGTFQDVYDDSGTEVSVVAAASRCIAVDVEAGALAALRYLIVRSGTTGTPVVQGAERTLTLILKA